MLYSDSAEKVHLSHYDKLRVEQRPIVFSLADSVSVIEQVQLLGSGIVSQLDTFEPGM